MEKVKKGDKVNVWVYDRRVNGEVRRVTKRGLRVLILHGEIAKAFGAVDYVLAVTRCENRAWDHAPMGNWEGFEFGRRLYN